MITSSLSKTIRLFGYSIIITKMQESVSDVVKIDLDAKNQQVSDIVESDSFKELKERARLARLARVQS